MKHLLLFLLLSQLIVSLSAQPARPGGPRGAPSQLGAPIKSGRLPDMDAYTADGTPIKVRDLINGKYTVLASGCLTCPQFHQGYPQIEAMAVDYAPKGVQFFYFYKSLRHPELEGYVQAQNMEERFLQLEEAREKLGTNVTWIADTLEDSMQKALKSGPNSLWLVSPDGEFVAGSDRISENNFRETLDGLVGAVENPTAVSDLDLPRLGRPMGNPNEDSDWGVARPRGMTILAIDPAKPDETYYVKLRAEADRDLLSSGTGRLFLGFYPDPIHEAKWNNLVDPMKYVLSAPDGVRVTPAEAVAKEGPGDEDKLPRQFWVDVDGAEPGQALALALHYYGCTPDFCVAMSHEYTIRIEDENRGSRTFGMNPRPRGAGGRAGPGGRAGGQRPGGPRGGGPGQGRGQ